MARVDEFGLGKQVAWGTKQTTMTYWPPITSVEAEQQVETLEVEENTGVRHPAGINLGTQFFKLQIFLCQKQT